MFSQRTKRGPWEAVVGKRPLGVSGPAETSTGHSIVQEEYKSYKSQPEQATVINPSNRLTEVKNLCSTKTVF